MFVQPALCWGQFLLDIASLCSTFWTLSCKIVKAQLKAIWKMVKFPCYLEFDAEILLWKYFTKAKYLSIPSTPHPSRTYKLCSFAVKSTQQTIYSFLDAMTSFVKQTSYQCSLSCTNFIWNQDKCFAAKLIVMFVIQHTYISFHTAYLSLKTNGKQTN